jgi:hypothetical protein
MKHVLSFIVAFFCASILNAQAPEAEPNNDFAAANSILPLQPIAGTINSSSHDYFGTQLPANGKVRVIIQATNTHTGNAYLYLRIYDKRRAAGQIAEKYVAYNIAQNATAFDTTVLYARAADSLFFRLETSENFSYQIKYQIEEIAPVDQEPNDDFENAIEINENQTKLGHVGYRYNGTFNAIDYYKTYLQNDGSFKLNIKAKNTWQSNGYFYLRVYDGRNGGGQILEKYITYNIAPTTITLDSTTIKVLARDSIYFSLYTTEAFDYEVKYTIADIPVYDVEPNNSFETAIEINENQTKQGHVGYRYSGTYNSIDYYKTYLQNDGSFKLMVKAKNVWPLNAYLYLRIYDGRNANGQILEKYISYNVAANGFTFDTTLIKTRARDSLYFSLYTTEAFDYDVKYAVTDIPIYDVEPNNNFDEAVAIAETQTKQGHIAYRAKGGYDNFDFYKSLIPKDGAIKIMVKAKNVGPSNGYLNLRINDGRKASGLLLQKYSAYNVVPGTIIYDTTIIKGRAVDSLFFSLETNEAFDYDIKYQMVDTSTNDDEPNNAFANAVLVNGGTPKYGHLAYRASGVQDNYDYYKTIFTTTDSLKLYIQATNKNGSNGYVNLRLFNKLQNQLFEKYICYNVPDNSTTIDSIKFLVTAPDTIYWRLEGTESFSYNVSVGNKLPNGNFGITGLASACPGSIVYKTTGVTEQGITWHWAVSGGGSLVFLDSVATINWTTPGAYTISCYLSNSLGNSQTIYYPIIVNAGPPAAAPIITNAARLLATNTLPIGATRQWYKDGVEIMGATDSVYYAADAGVYNAKFNNGCGSSATSNSFSFAGAVLPQTISFIHTADIVLTPTAFAKLNATASSGLPITYEIVSGAATLSNDTLWPTATGTVIVKALQNGNNLYGPAPAKYDTIFVVKGSQTITFTPIPNKLLSNIPFALDATASSGLPIVYSVVSGNATINGLLLTTTGVGNVVIKAAQAGNANYFAAPDVTTTFCIGIRQQLDTIDGPKIVCPTNLVYSTKNIAGALYQWTLSGGGTITPNGYQATINWTTPGNYTLSVRAYSACDTLRTIVKTISITVTPAMTPVAVTNMLPASGVTNLNLPFNLSWQPGSSTTKFDLYVWPAALLQPAIPTASDITEINYTLYNEIALGVTYNWRVVAKNECLSTSGPIHSFTASNNSASYPDLVMDSIHFNTNAIQGQQIDVTWRVKNIGLNSTNNSTWKDRIFISTSKDLRAGFFPPLIGEFANQSYLQPGQSYTQTKTVTIPQGLTGSYYLFVISDNIDALCEGTQCDVEWGPRGNHGSDVPEANEFNNYKYDYLIIDYGLLPDLKVKSVAAPTTTFSATPFNITYSVKNEGAINAIGSQITACPQMGWRDRFFVSKQPVFSANTSLELQQKNIQFFKNSEANCASEVTPYIDYLKPDSAYTTSHQLSFPHNYFGAYYLYVITNGNSEVYEGPYSTNNIKRSELINVSPTPPADLVVDNIINPPTTMSGTSAKIKWTVSNQGVNAPKEYSWVDSVFICSSATYNSNNILAKGAKVHENGTLVLSGNSYQDSITLPIPNGIAGNYYVYVKTDASFQVFEYNQDDNNILRSTASFTIQLTPPVDLIVSQIQAPDSLKVDSSFTITYKLKNTGIGNISNSSWYDNIYVSTDSSITGTKQLIGAYFHNNALLSAGDSVTIGKQITLKSNLGLENKRIYFFVETDNTNMVYEHGTENNNIKSSSQPNGTGFSYLKPTILPYSDPRKSDIKVLSITVAANNSSGDTINVSYTVKNQGSVATIAQDWNDAIYLSSDTLVDNFDTRLNDFRITNYRNTGLQKDSQYTRSGSVILPLNITGNKYLLLQNSLQQNDSILTNNLAHTPITIAASPVPDLVVTYMSSPPANAFSGSQFYIYYTVQNNGAAKTNGTGIWHDGAYFSASNFTSGGSQSGSNMHSSHLAAGATYSDSILINVPAYLSGNYYLILRTDNSNGVYEGPTGNNNNAVYALTNIIPNPIASDLIVSKISSPDSAVLGKDLSATMQIKNIGNNPAVGNLANGLYLSQNTIFESGSDRLVNSKQITNLVINPGDSIATAIMGKAIVHTAGNYYAIGRTNILNSVNEGSNTNNNGLTATNTTHVDATPLIVNVAKIDTVTLNNERYFKVAATANKDLQITLTTAISSNGTNEVLVVYNRVPTSTDYDVAGIDATTLNQKILVSDSKAGNYYIRVKPTSVSIDEPFSILVEELPFSIVSITPNVLGKSTVTTRLYGAGFKTNSQIILRNSTGTIISTGTIKKFENSTKLQVVWDFTNTPIGTYNLVVINPGGIEVVQPNAITIAASSGLQLQYTQLLPENLRQSSTGILTFRGKNTGNIDIPVIQGDFSVQNHINITNVKAVGIRKQSEFFKGNSYADNIINKSDSLEWVIDNGLKSVPVFGRNMAPGDEFEVSFNVSGFIGSNFLVQPRLYGYSANLLARTQLEFIETYRLLALHDSALLSNPNHPYLKLAQAGSKAFSDTVFNALFKSGFMSATDTVGMNINYACSRCMRNLPAEKPGFTSTSDTTIDENKDQYNAVFNHDLNISSGQTMQVRFKKSHYWPGYSKSRGAAGSAFGWNLIQVNGKVDLQATSGNRIKIELVSLKYNKEPGRLAGWYPAADTNWVILNADSGITNFDANKFLIENTLFTQFNSIYNGQFAIKASDTINGLPTKLRLVFIAHKPIAGEPGVPGVDGIDGDIGFENGEDGSPGGTGGNGAKGGKGGKGGNGFVGSGNGGNGGRGGNGGYNGGDGGDGGPGGNGGDAVGDDRGGTGGNAGPGGDAGLGAIACNGGNGNEGGTGGNGDSGGPGGSGSNGGQGNAGGSDGDGGPGGAGGAGSGGPGAGGQSNNGPVGGIGGIGGPPDPCKEKQPGEKPGPPKDEPKSKINLNNLFDGLKSLYPGSSKASIIANVFDIGTNENQPGANLAVKIADLAITTAEVGTYTVITASTGTVVLVEAPVAAASYLIMKGYNVAARVADYGISNLAGDKNGDYFGRGFVKDFIWTTDFLTSPADFLAGAAKFFFGDNQPPGPPPYPTPTVVPIKKPCDPNEIIGPRGYGSSRMVSNKTELGYSIHFENDSLLADVAAQRVVITQPIHANANPLTFKVGSFNFGGHTFNVPPNQATYFTVLNFDSLGYRVEVTAGIDIVKREAFWVFQTVDPLTGLAPANPLLGFLPINNATGQGTGFVNYTIKPHANTNTGDSIEASASIVFDVNDPIATNTWLNIIDAVAPTSSIINLPATTFNPAIDLHYTGIDDAGGSGIKSYNILVTDNGSAATTFVYNFENPDTTFIGEIGHTYAFYAIATDNVGNAESITLFDSITILSSNLVSLCPNSNFSFPAISSGTNPRWQVDTGSGFVNLSDGGIYSGTNTTTLSITNAPSSLYGYAYRCKFTGPIYSQVYTLKFEVIWNGDVSTAWENPANWSCNGLPDAGTDVIINTGKLNYPRLNTNTTIRTLKINNGATGRIMAGNKLTVVK